MKATIIVLCLMFSSMTLASPLQGLSSTGQAKLTWYFISVYRAELYTQTGQFNYGQYPQALEIEYLRSISKQELIDATRDQWDEQQLWHPQRQQWLEQLSTIFPDVTEYDKITFVVDKQGNNRFYYNQQLVGGIASKAFSQAFLDIWVSAKTTYPALRNKLIGETQ
jgi:hypothetical protein